MRPLFILLRFEVFLEIAADGVEPVALAMSFDMVILVGYYEQMTLLMDSSIISSPRSSSS